METIKYLKGDATMPNEKGNQIIVHICNDRGGWGKGFVLAISEKWTEPEKAYREWYKHRSENNFGLSATQLIQVSNTLFIGNMIAQEGLKKTNNKVPIRYDAVRACLHTIASEAKILNASIHMPRIGCGLAGGKWELIEPILIETLCSKNLNVFVYDF